MLRIPISKYPDVHTLARLAKLHHDFLTDCNHLIDRNIDSGSMTLLYNLIVIHPIAEDSPELWDFDCKTHVSKSGLIVTPLNKYSQIVWHRVELLLNNKYLEDDNENSKRTVRYTDRAAAGDGGITT